MCAMYLRVTHRCTLSVGCPRHMLYLCGLLYLGALLPHALFTCALYSRACFTTALLNSCASLTVHLMRLTVHNLSALFNCALPKCA